MSLFGGVKDVLFGSKKQQAQLSTAPLSAEEKEYNRLKTNNLRAATNLAYSPVSTSGIKREIAEEMKGERGAFGDTQRRLQQMSAQRGLSRSTVGLGAQLGATQRFNQRMGEIGGSYSARKHGLDRQRFSDISGLASGGPIQAQSFMGAPAKRGGGLLDLGLGLTGALAGGGFFNS